ncbi:MAG: hypothetical protein AAFR20_07180 [Pseudomonadota bacterium]
MLAFVTITPLNLTKTVRIARRVVVRLFAGLDVRCSRYFDQFLSPKHLDCMAAIAEHSMPKRA